MILEAFICETRNEISRLVNVFLCVYNKNVTFCALNFKATLGLFLHARGLVYAGIAFGFFF